MYCLLNCCYITLTLTVTSLSFFSRCETPSSLKNRNLLEIAPKDLICGFSLSRVLFTSMISFVCVLLLVMVTVFVIRRCRRRRRERKAARGDSGGNYTAVFTRDDDDVRISTQDDKQLLETSSDREFDVWLVKYYIL